MRRVMPEKTISVLGATGYTGGLIVEELLRRGMPVLAAGRNRDKLQQLAARHPGLETTQADVADAAALDQLAGRSRVLINTAGPFIDCGEPVVRAALAAGSHYLDTTGEQPFMKAMLAHDESARRQRVAVVSAQAFEVAVSDCAVAVAATGFSDVASVHVTYVAPFHASQGTQRTVLRMLQSRGYAYLGGEWVEDRPARMKRIVDFPAPWGRRTAVNFPSAEVITIPRHLAVREVRTFMTVSPLVARLLPGVAGIARVLLRSPLGALALQLVGSGTGGPNALIRGRDAFHIAIDVRGVRGGVATHQRAFVRGRDPYGLTAVIAAYGADLMSRPDYTRCGVLPPAVAFEPRALLDHLKDFGVMYEEGFKGSRVAGSESDLAQPSKP
jgi:short subunit dehydrogenase-like uncharacterized protein